MNTKRYYVQSQPRGNRIAYIVRESGTGIEVAWATTGDEAKDYIASVLDAADITKWKYHRVLGHIPA